MVNLNTGVLVNNKWWLSPLPLSNIFSSKLWGSAILKVAVAQINGPNVHKRKALHTNDFCFKAGLSMTDFKSDSPAFLLHCSRRPPILLCHKFPFFTQKDFCTFFLIVVFDEDHFNVNSFILYKFICLCTLCVETWSL